MTARSMANHSFHPAQRHLSFAILIVAIAFALLCCGPTRSESTAPANPESSAKPVEHPTPQDLSRYMARENLVSNTVVNDNLLGIEALPGGNLAEYKKGGRNFQQFLMKAPSVALGAVYLSEFKSAMASPKFVAGFGGYYGDIAGKPVFVFVKNEYVTGLIGLSKDEADAEGRLVAARIP